MALLDEGRNLVENEKQAMAATTQLASSAVPTVHSKKQGKVQFLDPSLLKWVLGFFQTEGIEQENIDGLARVFAVKVATDLRATAETTDEDGEKSFTPEAEDLMNDLFTFAKDGRYKAFMKEMQSKTQYSYMPEPKELAVINSSIHKSLVEMLKVTETYRGDWAIWSSWKKQRHTSLKEVFNGLRWKPLNFREFKMHDFTGSIWKFYKWSGEICVTSQCFQLLDFVPLEHYESK